MTEEQIVLIRCFVLRVIAERGNSASKFTPSEYWCDFARNFRYVYDLGKDELNRIRYHTYHLTSDLYLTYYFADESFRNLLTTGYRYFVGSDYPDCIGEGDDGIGVLTEYGRISHDLLRYLGVTVDLVDAKLLDRNTQRMIIEIGGGYGGLARVVMSYNTKITYFICDLEETLFFSSIYLTKHVGSNKVHLVDRELKKDSIEQGHIYIVPQSRIECLEGVKFDFAISQQSLQEMTQSQVEHYLEWLSRHVAYLYSCNIFDHAAVAKAKNLVVSLPQVFSSYFAYPVWNGDEPSSENRFGDNHLLRAVYKCQ